LFFCFFFVFVFFTLPRSSTQQAKSNQIKMTKNKPTEQDRQIRPRAARTGQTCL
jgi:hypothetical protein